MVPQFFGSARLMQSFRCRSCGATGEVASDSQPAASRNGRVLHSVLDLGSTPLANSLLRSGDLEKPEPVYPLQLVFCSNCSLCQITETVSPEILFRDYVYFSS